MHLILCRLHGDAAHDAGRLDALGGAALSVSGTESPLEDVVQRMLHASERLGGIVVLVVDVEVVVLAGLASLLAEEIVIDERLRRLAGELHHHTRRRVGIHVGILARHVIGLDVDNLQEDVARLGLAGNAALVAVPDVALGHVLASALHEFQLHHVLDGLHGHLALALHGNAVGYLTDECRIVACVGGQHSLADGSCDLLLVETDYASVSLYYGLYHSKVGVLGG